MAQHVKINYKQPKVNLNKFEKNSSTAQFLGKSWKKKNFKTSAVGIKNDGSKRNKLYS